jgi:hypothetical protein
LAQIGPKNASIWRIDKVCALPVLTDGLIHKRLFDAAGLDHLERLKSQPKKLVKFISLKVPMRNLPGSPKLIEEIVKYFFWTERFENTIFFFILQVNFFNQPNSFYFAQNFNITRTLQSGSSTSQSGLNYLHIFKKKSYHHYTYTYL